jgi:S1-C subfamily serine protease
VSPRTTATAAAAAILAGCGGGDVETTPARPAAALPPVFKVRVTSAAQRSGNDATAFAVGDGRAVTVAHVLRDGHPVYVAGRRARVLHVDRRLDVAVLAVRGVHAAAPLGGSAHAREQATVRVLRAGAARSLRATVRRTISARVRSLTGRAHVRPALELAAAVMPGDSGAPVVDRDGRVVGVIFAQASDQEPVAYALDARALGSILKR